MPELRKDIFTGRYVVIAPGRSKRPKKLEPKKMERKSGPCVFCEGMEAETPPELLAFSDDDKRKADSPGWRVRVFDNKFPTFVTSDNFDVENEGFYEKYPAAGAHEIVVTQDDEAGPATMDPVNIELMLRAYQERFAAHKDGEFVKYVLIIYNHGQEAGASLPHPHSQLFALPFVSKDIEQELEGSEQFHKEHGECAFCAVIEDELKNKKRLIFENKSFVVVAPYASQARFESWVMPRKHQQHFFEMTDDERADMAEAQQFVMKSVYYGLGNPPFNYFLNSAPVDGEDYPHYHWHLQILPALAKRAGLEYGTGVIVNTQSPEEAAEFLRDMKHE